MLGDLIVSSLSYIVSNIHRLCILRRLQEREILGDELFRVDAETERDVQQFLDVMKVYEEYRNELKRSEYNEILSRKLDLGQKAIDEALAKYEEVDEDVMKSYLMFDDSKTLDINDGDEFEMDVGAVNKLIGCMDDISI
jgi:hypothetical protein